MRCGAYHRLFQDLMIPRRKPIGLVFCPKPLLLSLTLLRRSLGLLRSKSPSSWSSWPSSSSGRLSSSVDRGGLGRGGSHPACPPPPELPSSSDVPAEPPSDDRWCLRYRNTRPIDWKRIRLADGPGSTVTVLDKQVFRMQVIGTFQRKRVGRRRLQRLGHGDTPRYAA